MTFHFAVKRKRSLSNVSIKIISAFANSPTEEDNRLQVILETIKVLLSCKCDPNVSFVPMPPLILAVFTKTPILLQELLGFNANPNISTIDEELTALHVLSCLEPCIVNVKMFEILLGYHANPNTRTSVHHWFEHNEAIQPNIPPKAGKSPLHILTMRYDFTNDSSGFLIDMINLLMVNGADINLFYLGHTPLTLAMLRGNIDLARQLLSLGANPNIILDHNMGVPLTVLILNRFKNIHDYSTIIDFISLLIEFHANPLNNIPFTENDTLLNGNAIEFMQSEFDSLTEKEKTKKEKKGKAKNKKGGKSKKKSKQSSSKTSHSKSSKSSSKRSKSSSKRSKSKKSKGSKRSKSDDSKIAFKHLLDVARKTLLSYIQTKAVEMLYEFTLEDELDDDLSENIAKILTPTVRYWLFDISLFTIKNSKQGSRAALSSQVILIN